MVRVASLTKPQRGNATRSLKQFIVGDIRMKQFSVPKARPDLSVVFIENIFEYNIIQDERDGHDRDEGERERELSANDWKERSQ